MAAGAALAATGLSVAGGLASDGSTAPTAAATAIPGDWIPLLQQAASSCPGLDWSVLAGVARVESDFGRSTEPGVTSGANGAGAEGPMQFLPASFAAYDHPVRDDPVATPSPPGSAESPYDATDAVFAAARLLCADGVASDPRGALVAYNCGSDSPPCQLASDGYASEVLAAADSYGSPAGGSPGPVGQVVLAAAASMIGRPYVWAAADPGLGFDCSGLTQWAYAQAGVALPHDAQAQYDLGPPGPAADLAPGDLVFFGGGRTGVDHVGVYVGDGQMLDAPHRGAEVRIDFVSSFTPRFVGATRPGGSP